MPTVVGKDETIKKRATCNKCGAINEYFPNEVRELYRGLDYGGGSDGANGFNCAGCGEVIKTKVW